MPLNLSEQGHFPEQRGYLSHQVVQQVINRLLENSVVTALKLEDMRQYGAVSQIDSSPEAMVKRMLRAEMSLIKQSYLRLLDGLPQPTEQPDLSHYNNLLKERALIRSDEEKAIRGAALGVEQLNNPLERLYFDALEELKELNQLIFSLAGGFPEDHAYHNLGPIEQDRVLFSMMFQLPMVLDFSGEKKFALLMPKLNLTDDEQSFMASFPSQVSDFIVVEGGENNGAVTDLLYQLPRLVTYFVGNQIRNQQLVLLKKVEDTFGSVSIKKFEAFERKANAVNLPVRVHFIELLKRHCQEHGELTVVQLIRDKKDLKHILIGGSPLTNRSQLETFKFTYQLKLDDQGQVEMTVATPNGEIQCSLEVVAPEDRLNIRLQTPAMRRGGEYTLFNTAANDPHQFDLAIQEARRFLANMRICNSSQLLTHGDKLNADIERVSSALCSEDSITGFFQGLRSINSLYPEVEYAVEFGGPTSEQLSRLVPPRSVWGKNNLN